MNKIADNELIIKYITQVLGKNSGIGRKELIDSVAELLKKGNKTDDYNALSQNNVYRSYIGTILTGMMQSGDIVSVNGEYFLKKDAAVVVDNNLCRERIYRMVKSRALTKSEIYNALQKHFGTDKTTTLSDDNALKQTAGLILSELVGNGTIIHSEGKYIIACSQAPLPAKTYYGDEEEFKDELIRRLCEKGGSNFEKFTANLLEKYFVTTGKTVTLCEVTGGCDDGGIDVVIDTVDSLGFREHIMVQTKCRRNIQTTETEVRGFYGAVSAENGTRGIFVTTATFHPCAEKLLSSIPDCVGVNKDKLFEIIKKTSYGIHRGKNGFSFDKMIF